MIYNKSIVNEKYGTCYPFYEVASTDPIVLCLLSHISSFTLFLPVGMRPPVHISAVLVDKQGKTVTVSLKDANNSAFGDITVSEADMQIQEDQQFPLWSSQGILLGYAEFTAPDTFIPELLTGLTGALNYTIPSTALRVLPYCTHSIQLPKPSVVQIGTDIPEYTYLGRGLLNTETSPGATSKLSISVYAETPIGDYTHVPVKSINGVSQGDIVWITQKDPEQDITVKTYDYILIQGYVEQ